MNVFTLISQVENAEKAFAPELTKIAAFEASVKPVLAKVDLTAIENDIASLIVTESKGKVTQAEALLAVQGIVGIGESLISAAQKLPIK